MGNKIFLLVILVILIGVGSFFAGMKYQESRRTQIMRQRFGNRGEGQLQQKPGAGMVRGEIINKDEGSITIKQPDESTKIILISENTKINKATEGSVEDLEIGKQTMVFGQENSDKSISATNIQLDFNSMGGMRGNY